MTALDSGFRKSLERAVVRARDIAEEGARAVLQTLAVSHPAAYPTMTQEQRKLRNSLRAKARILGETHFERGVPPLVEEIAYEQWHRLLFARFLAENRLLMHPLGGHLSIEECAEIAPADGADNGWDLAGRYAALMLPGIFRADDPAAQIRLASEFRSQLEGLVAGLPEEVFTSDDGLGWTYQFWQARRKDEVNKAGTKIGADELAPVTQLFTEDYMVRFLLENSLGAWWAARHPDSELIREMDYLRFADDGSPAAGSFPGWPERAGELTVMDPCCGSGHFLVGAFHLIRRMRMEEEGLDAATAADAVLRDNVFGLELDERCVQIATFALALEAWKSGGYRQIPSPQVACTGIPVSGQLEEWLRLAGSDENLRQTLADLHQLLQNAPSLGSLINPRSTVRDRGMLAPDWETIEHAMKRVTDVEVGDATVAGASVVEAARAATLVGGQYTLVTTNVPYLGRTKQGATLAQFLGKHFPAGKDDLATSFLERCLGFLNKSGRIAVVLPANWLTLTSYTRLRRSVLSQDSLTTLVLLGEEAWLSFGIRGPRTILMIASNERPVPSSQYWGIDASTSPGRVQMTIHQKDTLLRTGTLAWVRQADQLLNPDSRITIAELVELPLLARFADGLQGIATADYPRFGRCFWEQSLPSPGWALQQSTVEETVPYGGREHILWWQDGRGELANFPQARVQGLAGLGKCGVAVSQMRHLPVTIYSGDLFDNNTAIILPKHSAHLAAIWAFCSSPDFNKEVRKIDQKLSVTNATLVKVPFDLKRWQAVADEMGPLPEPHSDDPTQWLFKGHSRCATEPLQVAAARLLGYRWPQQEEFDELDSHADRDGIVPLVSVRGEMPASERLRALLTDAFGVEWSHDIQGQLLTDVGFAGRDFGAWLADGKGFFAQHARLFHNRPFIWQIWDGARDGFSVLVNCHKLTRASLDRLIYGYLGDWINRQEQARAAGEPGAEDRLIKARALKAKLEAIRDGEPPYDVYVRWKPLHEQPIGWDPDLNDGVRLNIRPFVEAGVLRAKFPINWNKDRGDNPPGSTARQYAAEAQQAAINRSELSSTDGRERLNDLHLSRKTKQEARDQAIAQLQTRAQA